MQPQMDVGTLTALPDSAHPRRVPGIQVVRWLIGVKIDVMEVMVCGPFQSIFETHAASVKTHSVA